MKKAIVVSLALFRELLVFPEGYLAYKFVSALPGLSGKVLASLLIAVLTFVVYVLCNEIIFNLGEPENTGDIYGGIPIYFLRIFSDFSTVMLIRFRRPHGVFATAFSDEAGKELSYAEIEKYGGFSNFLPAFLLLLFLFVALLPALPLRIASSHIVFYALIVPAFAFVFETVAVKPIFVLLSSALFILSLFLLANPKTVSGGYALSVAVFVATFALALFEEAMNTRFTEFDE